MTVLNPEGFTPHQRNELDRHIEGEYKCNEYEGEWVSVCCGAPPHEASPDIDESDPAGICGQCQDFTGFELEK